VKEKGKGKHQKNHKITENVRGAQNAFVEKY
jgi:hypothetical protein